MTIRNFETETYSSFHALANQSPWKARMIAFWPCTVSVVCATVEIFQKALHPLQNSFKTNEHSLAKRTVFIIADEAVHFGLLAAIPLLTPIRYLFALYNPKSISPLWGFPYPCHCPTCHPPLSKDPLDEHIKPTFPATRKKMRMCRAT
jgi:hypothetical protein